MEDSLANLLTSNEEQLNNLIDVAKDFAVHKGICMRKANATSDLRVPASFCLFPTKFPAKWFELAKDIQSQLNFVIHMVSHSPEFLYNCLKSTIEEDPFTAQIWNIYDRIQKEGAAQPVSFGMLRSDYMLNGNESGEITGLKQIENNCIASSFSGLATQTSELHRFILERRGFQNVSSKLPENPSRTDYAKGMVAAWKQYGKDDAAILFVVEEVVYNICDQRETEFAVLEIDHRIKVIRHTFAELRTAASIEHQRLFVNGQEIAIVYYRTGYTPAQYTSEDWELRLLMERSLAIKCPSVGYHLAGTKAVQLHLSQPGVVERFLPEGTSSEQIRLVFAQQHSLGMNEEGDKAIELGMKNPEGYVLKPEREGGGNNVFGEEICTLLDKIRKTTARKTYILMERINPPVQLNCILLSNTAPEVTNVVSELGIYGVILGTKDEILQNYQAGHLLRTRRATSNEVGIAAGFGALDSPYLT